MNAQEVWRFNNFKNNKESSILSYTKLNENLIKIALDKINLIFDDGLVECDILINALCPRDAHKDGRFCFSLIKLNTIKSKNKQLYLFYSYNEDDE